MSNKLLIALLAYDGGYLKLECLFEEVMNDGIILIADGMK